jgi:hypothetical protein
MADINLRPLLYELRIITKERGLVRLGDTINASQEKLIDEVHRQLNTTGQIRIVVLKARQMGISTVIEGIIFILSILYSDFQSMIISHEQDSAEHILTMTKRYWATYPFKRFHEERYAAKKQLAWADTNSNIMVATAKNTSAGRSKTLHALHASEVAFWDDPDTLVTGLRQSIPSIGLSAIFYESTANGIGNFFHSTWIDAINDDNEFEPLFFPWHEFPQYTSEYLPSDANMILGELTQEEKELRSKGISESRLVWRRWAIRELCGGDINKFKQEYPSNWLEAFLSTGLNVFRLPSLTAHFVRMKGDVGRLERKYGREVHFIKDPDGPLIVYRHPSPDRNWGIYQIGADPTHTVQGDNACAQVISRRTLEQCAVLSLHTNPRDFGEQLILLGEYYNVATVAPEKTGPGYATVSHMLAKDYPAVWESVKLASSPGQVTEDTFGWTTNVQTKHVAVSSLVQEIERPLAFIGQTQYGLVIHHEQTYNEMRDYVTTENGGYQNGNGSKYDDCVMALAIAVATHHADGPLRAYSADQTAREIAQEVAGKLASEEGPKLAIVGGHMMSGTRESGPVAPEPNEQTPPNNPTDPDWMDWQ